jgi:hypothetical protein
MHFEEKNDEMKKPMMLYMCYTFMIDWLLLGKKRDLWKWNAATNWGGFFLELKYI